MKTLSIGFLLVIAANVSFSQNQTINPIIKDISFERSFNRNPQTTDDETTRIRTHLKFVEQKLRGADVSHLTPQLQLKREQLLNHLHNYWIAGRFPKNYDHPGERRPCFIDRNGTICAVGYLVEQSAGRTAAEAINKKFQYSEILAMNDPTVDSWISASGLTKSECAMIQPTYGYEPILEVAAPTTGYYWVAPPVIDTMPFVHKIDSLQHFIADLNSTNDSLINSTIQFQDNVSSLRQTIKTKNEVIMQQQNENTHLQYAIAVLGISLVGGLSYPFFRKRTS